MTAQPAPQPPAAPGAIFLVGLRAEAAILIRAGAAAVIGREALAAAIAQSPAGIVSFGLCGGLDPALETGALVIADAVVDEAGRRYPVDPVWRQRLADALPRAAGALLAGSEQPVGDPAHKAALRRRTGAAAVDTESHFAAALAQRWRLPFVAVRAVCDAAARELPPAALAGLRPDGRADLAAVLRCLVRDPRQIPALAGVAIEAGAALRSARACAALVVAITGGRLA